ncbi:DUF1622 domain-containing protein [Anabaena sp. UHCC 0187]|uniref:DUF1622 domain-containing protein n=1 Tax=Anabaena sp. UHCC 0187 TaxID=2590018 RepID=UPI001447E470|nr:DUF1622 domain-containing protein [Anabaena sp. UHCC 0187]MDP5017201.1 DUF1622 domain-containing protein [Dolichospermum sp.]MTJ12853.1 DUF1622 domain-containing protein [Anabaena sp. UHCC 0187]
MVLLEQLESGLAFVITLLKFLLESIAVFCILLGVLKTGKIAISLNHHHSQNRFLQIRLNFGIWLVLALEFQLGSDILSTTLSSTFESLGKLGIVALIRTFLNYFLTQELDQKQ